jgi:hypothetical protein
MLRYNNHCTCPEVSRKLRHLDSKNMKVVRLSVLRTGHLYSSGNIPGTHFYQRLSRLYVHCPAGRIKSMKNSNGTIGNRTRDFPARSTVLQPTASPNNVGRETGWRTTDRYQWPTMTPNGEIWRVDFLCGSFNDAASVTDHMASNGRVTVEQPTEMSRRFLVAYSYWNQNRIDGWLS